MDITALQSAVQRVQDAETVAASELKALADQVVALQQQGPENFTQTDLDSLASQVQSTADALTQASQTASDEISPPPPEQAQAASDEVSPPPPEQT